MNKLLSLLLFACLAVTGLTAQVSVSGTLFIGVGQGTPLADYPIVMQAPVNGTVLIELTETDENGNYSFNLANAVITESVDWTIETLDPCTLINVSRFFEVAPNELEYTIDLVVCDSINPPPPPDTCVAFFDYEETAPLTFQFTTLTADFLQIDSLRWDFGDGNTSDQLGPQHTYAENGAYPVTLTVYTPTCASTSTNLVFAFDPADCGCDTNFDPVCAFSPNGVIITFSNACEAECSGYPFNQLFDCSDQDCVCPTFNAPVCVIDPSTGDSLSFLNHCFAECEGYGPDQWIECSTVPDTTDCACELQPSEPICVLIQGQVIPFNNPCEVECVGLSGFPIVDCDSIPGGCNCFEIYDPVCVIDSTAGITLTFTNSCYAECEGYGPDQWIACAPDTLECNFFPFPVCVLDTTASDTIIAFASVCDALDAGYTYDDLNGCDTGNECAANVSFNVVSDNGLTFDFAAGNLSGFAFETYAWDFGDGTSSTEIYPRHTFADYGEYLVTVTGISGDCIATATISVLVSPGDGPGAGCQAFFFFEQPDPDNLLTYQFINFTYFNSSFPPEVSWDFGDGTTSNELNPLHTFPGEGSYTVTLSINDSIVGCQSSIGIAINAGENIWYGDLECRAWFLPIIDTESATVYFANWSSFDAVEFFWDFGDGTLSNDFEATHQYADAGVYTVNLTIVSSSGCTNTYSVTIDIASNDFTSNPSFRVLSSTNEASKATLPLIEAFPNPTRDLVTIRWENGTSGTYDWSLFDVAGRKLQSSNAESTTASNRFNVDLSNQPAGLYFLQVRTQEGLQVLRLSKVE